MILEVGQTKSFQRKAAPAPEPETYHSSTQPSPLLDLPYELRQSILQYTLRQQRTLQLQSPLCAGLHVFAQPLFHVCRPLRDEALDAFYQSNDFLWVIDTEHTLRSFPSSYPSPTPVLHDGESVHPDLEAPLTPILPWQYPRLMKNLRRLQINVYLPQARDAWALQERLTALVNALDKGRRLAAFHILVTAKRRAAQIPLTMPERTALEVLAEMEVRGKVDVQTRYSFRAVTAGVQSLDLQRRMKAH
ncbi:Hypothetical predicted protein [Lecanosticta acicola]|uniref:Uncharacterized protein n=1 Tax=Lecanosticta acicola TaxID=111012 RepID=A0AAI8Z3E3_9PEZI|nr:Hypothetical predicted protein [Lecanosticta acicola]